MKKFIHTFKNEEEKNLNIPLIKRKSEQDLVTCIVDIFKSLEVTGYVTFENYEVFVVYNDC